MEGGAREINGLVAGGVGVHVLVRRIEDMKHDEQLV